MAAQFQDPVSFKTLTSLAGIKASSNGSPSEAPSNEESGKDVGIICPTCRYSEENFNTNGRLGCPNCYEVFDAHVEKILPEMHRGTNHKGKIPAHLESAIQKEALLQSLEHSLQEAIKLENFEEAAQIRDKLRSLRSEHRK